MAGRYTIGYWFDISKKEELLKGRTIEKCGDDIGVKREYLTKVINGRIPIKLKVIAYAIAKETNKNYEIEDIFEIRPL